MGNRWRGVADRLVQGLGVQPGELVEVRDGTGDLELLVEIQLAVERAGATPNVLLLPAGYLQRLWTEIPAEYLARWDEHRQAGCARRTVFCDCWARRRTRPRRQRMRYRHGWTRACG